MLLSDDIMEKLPGSGCKYLWFKVQRSYVNYMTVPSQNDFVSDHDCG